MQTTPAPCAVDDVAPDVQPTEDLRPDSPAWGPVRKLLFLFAFVYLVLYNFPSPLYSLHIDQVDAWYFQIRRPLVSWVAEHVFHVILTAHGGGDSVFAYVQIFCFLLISIAAAMCWSLLDRKRRNYARLYEWLRVYIRFVLAVTMIEYGAWKIFPSQ